MIAGASLKQARAAKKLAFADITRETRIQGWVLQALEADQLHLQMSPVYAKSFLMTYAKFLGLNPVPLVAELQAALAPPPPAAPELPPAAPASPLRMPQVKLPKVELPKFQAPKITMPKLKIPTFEIPWVAIRRAAPAFAVAAVIVGVVAVNPAKQFAKIEWPKFQAPKIAFKLPKLQLPKIAFKLPSLPKSTKTAKAPASKKIAAKPAAKPVAKPIVVAVKPTAKVSDELAKVPALPEPQMTVAPRVASVAPTLQLKTAELPALQLVPTAPLELVLLTTRATWVQVRVDGKLLAERRLPRGSKERWSAKRTIDLVVAHPTDIELKLNGQSISPFAVAYRGRMRITHRGVVQLAAASE